MKFLKFPLVKSAIRFLKAIKPPGFYGFSIYDLLEMYILGIVKGALTYRAGSISFSFFMALFPFILFILNLIPFIDLIPFIKIENFDQTFLNYLELFLQTVFFICWWQCSFSLSFINNCSYLFLLRILYP